MLPTGSATYRGASQLRAATLPVMAGDLATWAPVPSPDCGDPRVTPPHLPPRESPGGTGGNAADMLEHAGGRGQGRPLLPPWAECRQSPDVAWPVWAEVGVRE